MPQPIRFYISVIAAIVVLFIIGAVISVQSVEIGDCKATWYSYTKSVKSDLCPNPSVECNAEPYKQQHNAIVDMLLCACSKQNRDITINSRIEDVYNASTGMPLTAEQICSGQQLMKWRY